MYKIYLSDKVIIITSDASPYINQGDDYCIDVNADTSVIDQAKLLKKVQTTKRLVLIAKDSAQVYNKLVSQFRLIKAAGGLVTNANGEVLMIFRLGKWDLPKGKVEENEDIMECAIREVEEECGVKGLSVKRELIITTHIYAIGDEWVIKQTHWYAMSCDYVDTPKPQLEEDITAVEWIEPSEIKNRLSNSYNTIIDVFESNTNSPFPI